MWLDFAAMPEQPEPIEVPAALLVAGHPQWRVWRAFDRGAIRAGRFYSTPGRWKWGLSCWEYFLVRAGRMVIHPRGGAAIALQAGGSMVIGPGFAGEIEVVEDLVQEFFVDARP